MLAPRQHRDDDDDDTHCASASRATSSTRRGEPAFGREALAILDSAPDIDWEYLPEVVPRARRPTTPRATTRSTSTRRACPAAAVARDDCRLRVVARHGVGYDSVDVPAMTRAGVVVTNTPSAMPRPVATIALTFILALAGKLMLKDRLTRTRPLARAHGQHGHGPHRAHARRRSAPAASARSCCAWRARSTCKLLAADPYVERGRARLPRRAQGRPRRRCCAKSDFVVACCLLERSDAPPGRRARSSRRCSPTAYFINVARGPVVDEPALIAALRDGRIAGAALDVFEQEPVDPANPLLAMDNVIVTPHSLCWTDECFHNMAIDGPDEHRRRACPAGVRSSSSIREVLDHPRVKGWLRA